MTTVLRRTFAAKYDGACGACGQRVTPGDEVFYVTGNENVIGLECCGDRPDGELVAHQRPETDDTDLTVDITRVMPRGRTARDACPKCWVVPASNGVCGCDP